MPDQPAPEIELLRAAYAAFNAREHRHGSLSTSIVRPRCLTSRCGGPRTAAAPSLLSSRSRRCGSAELWCSAREATAMGNAKSPEPRPPRPAGIPRWLALALAPVVWLVALPAVHAGIPWALSHLGPRYGWADGGPSGWNLLGCVPVAVGAVLLAWIMVFGLSRYRD